jgi:hypothetical protein
MTSSCGTHQWCLSVAMLKERKKEERKKDNVIDMCTPTTHMDSRSAMYVSLHLEID